MDEDQQDLFKNIDQLIAQNKLQEVMRLIEDGLTGPFDLSRREHEQIYSRLLHKRISVQAQLGLEDEVVLDTIHKLKYPSERIFTVNKKHRIVLWANNLFQFECDAYVNSIHCEKLLNLGGRSASEGFVKRIPEADLDRQLAAIKEFKKGHYIVLHHPYLTAPVSYQILCYEDDNILDFDALSSGLERVLRDVATKGMSKVGMIPLGFDAVATADDGQRGPLAEKIADKIAQTILEFLWASDKRNIPQLYFNFVSLKSFETFEKAFTRWTHVDKDYLKIRRELNEKEMQLINDVDTRSAKYIQILKRIRPELNEDSSILITGETGVGKSYLARLIHKYGNRSSGPFVVQNCAMVRPEHLYATLFGSMKGSYTDSKEDRPGLVEKAEKGILFLDEIGYAVPEVQRAIMTFVEDKTFRRLGDKLDRTVNVRLIFGTNQNLFELIELRLFQRDLYERMAHLELEIPALRERPDDTSVIITKILTILNDQKHYTLSIDEAAMKALVKFKWPGNIRQLKAYIERMHNECVSDNMLRIQLDWIDKNPPRDQLYSSVDTFSRLESLLTQIMRNWDGSQGKLTTDLIEPILAKIYLDDLHLSKEDASKILGLDGSAGKNATLTKRIQKYPESKKLLGN